MNKSKSNKKKNQNQNLGEERKKTRDIKKKKRYHEHEQNCMEKQRGRSVPWRRDGGEPNRKNPTRWYSRNRRRNESYIYVELKNRIEESMFAFVDLGPRRYI